MSYSFRLSTKCCKNNNKICATSVPNIGPIELDFESDLESDLKTHLLQNNVSTFSQIFSTHQCGEFVKRICWNHA